MSTGETKNTGGFLGVWKNKFIFAIVVKTWIDNIYIMFTKILYIYVYFSFIVCFFTIFYRPVLMRVHWVREQPQCGYYQMWSHGCQTLTGLRQLLHADRRRASKWVAPSVRWTQLLGFYLHLQEAWHESLAKRGTTNEWMNKWQPKFTGFFHNSIDTIFLRFGRDSQPRFVSLSGRWSAWDSQSTGVPRGWTEFPRGETHG